MKPIMAGNPSSSWWSLNKNNNNMNSIRASSHQHQQQLQLPLFPSPSFFPFHQFVYNIPAATSSNPPPLSSPSPSSTSTVTTTSSSSTASSSSSYVAFSPSYYHDNQLALQLPDQLSWNQLLLGGLAGVADPAGAATTTAGSLNQVLILQENDKVETYPLEDPSVAMHHHYNYPWKINSLSPVNSNYNMYLGGGDDHHGHDHQQKPSWTTAQLTAVHEINMFPAGVHNSFTQVHDHDHHQSSSISTATTFNFPSLLQCFPNNKSDPTLESSPRHQSTNCPSQQSNNSSTDHGVGGGGGGGGGGVQKKARVEPSISTQSSFKVRKERMGDKITVLHQLVSPFGKTDTASVLLEAIGCIRFLQSQIEALSVVYMNSGPELNQGSSDQEENKDLRSRGLCLVPLSSCTTHASHNSNGSDFWSPALRQQ